MQITAGMVKTLREKTGLPMMECKHALQEAGGDEQRAIDVLREKGLSKMARFQDREAAEGRIACYIDTDTGRAAMVELRCETQPVADTEDFRGLLDLAVRAAAAAPEALTPEALREQPLPDDASRRLSDRMDEVFNRLRENLKIANVHQLQGHVAYYVHFDNRKGVMVQLSGPCPADVAGGVCMHITAIRPLYLRRDEVDAQEVQAKRAEFRREAEGKPPQVVEKIVEGKLNRWYSEDVLLDQPYAKDDKKTVGQVLREVDPNLTIERFVRFEVGAPKRVAPPA